jgi:NADPH-dependent glutamate synthase beta subunit-like oxidoreductase
MYRLFGWACYLYLQINTSTVSFVNKTHIYYNEEGQERQQKWQTKKSGTGHQVGVIGSDMQDETKCF